MHIPDGFLDLKTAVATGVLAAAGLGYALREARRTLPARKVPLLGLSAAFVFASQMLNFPVIGGTSGHLVGAVLTAALLGPSAAVIVLSAVLIVQCLMFADGGLTALGANILNMGIIGGVVGWMIYAGVSRLVKGLFGSIFAAVVASWASIVLAAILCAGELAASRTVRWNVAFPAMTFVHMLIGIGEAVITALVLSAIAAVRPELLRPDGVVRHAATRSYRPVLVFGLIAAMALALFASPFASTWPDGLDKAAEDLGFKEKESVDRALPAPVADYRMPGITSQAVATSIAGGLGTLAVLGGAWLLTRALVPKSRTGASTEPPPSA
jgi:cobalt/nickel transport system permease protein